MAVFGSNKKKYANEYIAYQNNQANATAEATNAALAASNAAALAKATSANPGLMRGAEPQQSPGGYETQLRETITNAKKSFGLGGTLLVPGTGALDPNALKKKTLLGE